MFRAKAPLGEEGRGFLEEGMAWMIGEFGMHVLRERPTVQPTAEFFPDPYDGSDQAAARLIYRVADLMQVDSERFDVEVFEEGDDWINRNPNVGSTDEGPRAAGLFYSDEEDGKLIVAIERRQLADPFDVVATCAHELGHVLLLGDGRLDESYEAHEPMTDLLTVYFGLGIFTANSSFQYKKHEDALTIGWQIGTKGYLNEEAFGYALALYAWLREERRPRWTRHLDGNIPSYFKQSARWLAAHPPQGTLGSYRYA